MAGVILDVRENPVVARLSKLAGSGQTGALRLSGDFGGAVYVQHGEVVYAESRRTPGLSALLTPPGHGGQSEASSFRGPLAQSMAVREATADAVLELISGVPLHPLRLRFQASVTPGFGPADSMPVEALIAEMSRRLKLVQQMSAVLTADTHIMRSPQIGSRAVRVSAGQWALLVRSGDRSTPRRLALELGRSVFATTIEAAHLVSLQLLSVVSAPASLTAQADSGPSGRRPPRVSFLRAVTQCPL